jgi:hypothetical protein
MIGTSYNVLYPRPGAVRGLRPHPGRVLAGAPDRAKPNLMGPASLGLDIGIFCDFLYSVLLLRVILGLYLLGLALSRPQVLACALFDERHMDPGRGVRARSSAALSFQTSRGTECMSEFGMKRMSGGAKRQCDRTRCARPRAVAPSPCRPLFFMGGGVVHISGGGGGWSV